MSYQCVNVSSGATAAVRSNAGGYREASKPVSYVPLRSVPQQAGPEKQRAGPTTVGVPHCHSSIPPVLALVQGLGPSSMSSNQGGATGGDVVVVTIEEMSTLSALATEVAVIVEVSTSPGFAAPGMRTWTLKLSMPRAGTTPVSTAGEPPVSVSIRVSAAFQNSTVQPR